ncbi:hypothetical protein BGX33_009489 [Mortierella sp. NVP41]|nr:hypothetical protein BGX33_009489 [Mortierella sp. NVP41]
MVPRTSASSKSSALLQELQLQDQIVPSWEESSQETEGSFAESLFQEDKEEDDEKEKEEEEESQVCRVYVLKDVTEMHSLALAARTDALRRERASASRDSAQQLSDPGLLLLHVTRFGTVDHAIAIPQQKQQQLSIQPSLLLDSAQDECIIKAMTNTSVMSYVHPDDIRALCQGLDRACKALYTVFRIRWRLGGQDHLLESDRLHHHHQQCPFDSASSTQEGSVRLIEFQGESFEEYVDPTAVPNSSLTFRVSNDGHTLAKYAWAEITGVLSNSQPLLVVRPLTAAELSDQSQEAALATAAAAAAASNSSTIASSRRSNARGLDVQKKKGWKTKSKRMNLEEGMRMPKQLNLSALTSLSRHDETDLRMPVSPPLSMPVSQPLQQQPSQQLMTPTRCRNPSGHANPMPSFLAFPSNATLPWSGMFLTIALDAWKQWIQTVYAGQAQFQDWCEYLLETTIDQMIESVALGLTLLGFEEAPVLDQYRIEEGGDPTDSTIAASALQRKNKQIRYTDRDVTIETWADSHPVTSTATTTTTSVHYQQQQKAIKHQQTLSGLNRAGKILHSYPSIEGVVRNIGKTWLGRKIKSRLERKLDVVADQVVDWWEAGEVHIAAWSPLMRSFSSSSGATVTELSVVDDLDLSSSSLSPVVVVVPATLVE